MNKEQLVKLAEIAGYEDAKDGDELHRIKKGLWWSGDIYVLKKGDLSNLDPIEHLGARYEAWHPHTNITQAFEVLEGGQESDDYIVQLIKSPDYHLCQLESPCRIPFVNCTSGMGKTHAEAICQAVLKVATK